MSNYKYEVDSKNEIKVWDLDSPNENDAPFFYQPTWPDNTPWASKQEATDWAELFIESMSNPESEFIPGDGPDEPRKPRPVATAE